MLSLIAALTLGVAPPVEGAPPPPPRRIVKIIERANGASAETAFKVRNVGEEYQVIQALGLDMRSQALRFVGRRFYDVLTVDDLQTGEERELWFDISSFFGPGS
jgi:hypothetical protein